MPSVDITTPRNKQQAKDALLQEEVEKYKQEVLEGLQIEEEGLTDLIRKKTKQAAYVPTPRSYNDPFDSVPDAGQQQKLGQHLKASYLNGHKTIAQVVANNETDANDDEGKIRHHHKRHIETNVGRRRRKRHHHPENRKQKNRFIYILNFFKIFFLI